MADTWHSPTHQRSTKMAMSGKQGSPDAYDSLLLGMVAAGDSYHQPFPLVIVKCFRLHYSETHSW